MRRSFICLWILFLPLVSLTADLLTEIENLHRSEEFKREYALLLDLFSTESTAPEQANLLIRLSRVSASLARRGLRDGESRDVVFEHFTQGEAYATLALESSPGNYLGYYWRSYNRFYRGQARGMLVSIDQAASIRSDLENAIIANPNHAASWELLGILYRQLPGLISFGNIDFAVSLGRKAVSLSSEGDFHPYIELARHLNHRDWNARKRYDSLSAKSYEFHRRQSPLEKNWFFEGTLEFSSAPVYADKPLTTLSDREEALALLRWVRENLSLKRETVAEERRLLGQATEMLQDLF